MKRIKPADAKQHEAADAETPRDAVLIIRSDHEAAEDEEEIDEEIGVPDQRKSIE